MEEKPKIEISETNRGKEQIIVEKTYKYNFSTLKKDNSKVYRCTEYRTSNKCKSFIILNDKKEILKYEGLHNHLEKEKKVAISITKHKIKNKIRESLNPFDIRPKRLFNKISQEMGPLSPEYNTIKSQISRNINKQLPLKVTSFEDIPDELEYYSTVKNEKFMIFKNSSMIIFQSPFQANLFTECDDIFADGTFYIAPDFSYQVFITRTYVKALNIFYTTSFSILKNKKQSTYEKLFEEIKKNVSNYNNNIKPKTFHCDFEKAISNSAKKIFPDINIKYCVWHYKRSLQIKKNKLCSDEIYENINIYTYYKFISNLPFINPEYIIDIYNIIKSSCQEQHYDKFLKFLEYFDETFLGDYKKEDWNYYNNIEHITNNACESFNNYLNNLFETKPSFCKLLYTFQNEESLSYNDFKMRTSGYWRKKIRKSGETEKIRNKIEKYKDMESELIDNRGQKKDIIELWFKCLIDLNN